MHPSEYQSWEDLGSPFFQLSNSLWALIPLEAWRRGLRVQLRPNARYVISGHGKSMAFRQTRLAGEPYDNIAKICDDKHATKNILVAADVPTPAGAYFKAPLDREEIVAYATSLGYPVCLKPNAWAKAKGVFPKVEDSKTFRRLLDHLIDELNCPEILVEEHVAGSNVRVFVTGNKIIAASHMQAANVVGNGLQTLEDLIAAKNSARLQNPHLGGCKIVIDEEASETLLASGLNLQFVPENGQTVFLRKTANISKGGDSVDVTHRLSEQVRRMAISTIKAVPGLDHGGVDIITLDPTDENVVAKVNEINPSAGLGPHIYPAAGNRTNPPSAIIDHYFPNSERLSNSDNWYFALNPIIRLFSSNSADSVGVSPMPQISDPAWRTLSITNFDLAQSQVRRSIMQILSKLDIHGEISAPNNVSLSVKFTGSSRDAEDAVRRLKKYAAETNVVIKVASIRAFRVSPGFRSV